MPLSHESAIPESRVDDWSASSAWVRKLVVWAAFLLFVYLIRDFFLMAFMTFMFSYVGLNIINWIMRKLKLDPTIPGLQRLVTLIVFILGPIALAIVGVFVLPELVAQCQRLAGWFSRVSPETEMSRLLESYVGPWKFRQEFGGPADPRYVKAFGEFRQTGEKYVDAYNAFPKLEDWIEGGFAKQFAAGESARIRSELLKHGGNSKDFDQWFRNVKFPELRESAAKKTVYTGPLSPLIKVAGNSSDEQLKTIARHSPAIMAELRNEWLRESVDRGIAEIKNSQEYEKQFRAYYESLREKSPSAVPYTVDQFIELQKARPKGPAAFGETYDKVHPRAAEELETQIKADFESAMQHNLFVKWWSTSSFAKFVRNQVESNMSGENTDRLERLLAALLNIPLDVGTALLLSFFICIDFPRLKAGWQSVRQTWLGEAYDEITPALSRLGQLVGKAMQAQGLISLCNATIMFIALTILGVEHAMLLAGAVFVLCLVPTLGMILAWVLIVGVALVQPGGGFGLAMKASVAVAIVVLLETFVFSPRILGKIMELHPVLIIAILPIAHSFFGVWGLILATPVAVFVINEVIFFKKRPPAS